MPTVLLVTFQLMPEGEPRGDLLVAELGARGIGARWACWDDASVDWSAADLVAVRATWDYDRRLPDFLAWAQAVDAAGALLNGADVFAWNADKAYLLDIEAAGVPVVPSLPVDDATLLDGLTIALDKWGPVVVKPRTGAGGRGVVVAESVRDERLGGLAPAPWLVQPLVESVRSDGESSVFVLGGRAVSQVDKVAAGEEVRVHEQYGGRSTPVPLEPERARVAEDAVRAAAQRTGRELAYARVDQMRYDGRWAVSEVELIEPGLYLDVDPANAGRFADLVAGVLAGAAGLQGR